ncbi:MAG: DNA polymerase III subunit delta [Bacteroidales bacterium]|nr:DNA polymerase III subunit delta [Bacteroidales bacterium]
MYESIIKELKAGQYKPVYFLMGEEPYYIDKITEYISINILSEADKAFNQTVIYGKDAEAATVINAAKRFPMMCEYQVVIVKEAQQIKNIDDLVYYVQRPLKSTILVINYKYKKLDKRKKLYKEIEKNGVIFDSAKLYDNEVPGWIASYLKSQRLTISPTASLLLAESLGNDLSKISNELEKLKLTLPSGETAVTESHIEKTIGISKDYNNFELHKALTQRKVLKANQIINYFGANPNQNPMVLTITSLYFFFSKVLMYHFLPDKSQQVAAAALKVRLFVKDYASAAKSYPIPKAVEIISLLREYDLKSKGVNNTSTPDGQLLKELVFKILH